MFKRKFDYGLILTEHLKKSPGEFLDVRNIANEYKIPRAYLEKIAQELRRAGLLESRRGAGGGYRLKKEDVSVSDIINLFDRPFEICPINRLKLKL